MREYIKRNYCIEDTVRERFIQAIIVLSIICIKFLEKKLDIKNIKYEK